MIGFLLYHKLKYHWVGLKNPWKILLTAGLTITAILYGRIFSEIFNKLSTGEMGFMAPEKFMSLTLGGLALFTIFRMIFPVYKPLKQLFPSYYPLSKMEVYASSLFNDFIFPYFFYLLVFIITGGYFLQSGRIVFILQGCLVLAVSQLIRRLIQYVLDYRLKPSGQWCFVITGSLVLFIGFRAGLLMHFMSHSLLIGIVLLFLSGFYLENVIVEKRNKELSGHSMINNIHLKLLFNNPKARLPILVGILFKMFILTADLISFKTNGEHLFDGQIIFWLFVSPLFIFTYVFNNIWGFWKNLWLNWELRVGDYKPMILLGLKLMLLPLIVDALLTIPLVMMTWNNLQFILLFYTVSAVFLLLCSFAWSLFTPRKISATFQMKGSTSPWSSFAAAGGVLMLATIKLNYWFYIMIPLCLIMACISCWLSIDLYREKKYRLVEKLIKG
jgi:hypothetical protein